MDLKDKEIRIGIAGFGFIGKWYLRCFQTMPGVKVIGVVDNDSEMRREAETQWQLKAYADYRDMLEEDNIDVMIVGTPPFAHYNIIKDSLQAGKHIICEKPIGHNYTEAMRIAEVVRSYKQLFMVNFMERFNMVMVEAKNYIKNGRMGDLIQIKGTSRLNRKRILNMGLNTWLADTKKGGGPIVEMLIHNFDMLRWITESEVTRVYASGGVYFYNKYPELQGIVDFDNVGILAETKSGVTGLFDGSFSNTSAAPMFDFRAEVMGTEGCMDIDFTGKPLAIFSEHDGVHYPEPTRQGIPGGSYYLAFQQYIESIRQNRILPSVATLDDGLANQAIAEACVLSIKQKKAVDLPL